MQYSNIRLPFEYTGDDFDNDLHYACYVVEYIARELMQPNIYVAQVLGDSGFELLLNDASYYHCFVINEFLDYIFKIYTLMPGTFDITEGKFDLPDEITMGRVYANLFEDLHLQTLIELYSLPICKVLDNYNNGAYFDYRKCIANNFTTPNDRFYGKGYYCTPYKPLANRWSETYGGVVKRINAYLPGGNYTHLDKIVLNYVPAEDEELLIAPLPNEECIIFLDSDPKIIEDISSSMSLKNVFVYRKQLPEDRGGPIRLYTVISA